MGDGVKKQIAVFAATVLFFSLIASALSVSIPSNVTGGTEETRFFATIENTSAEEKGLSVSYSSPAKHRLFNVPSTIRANSSATIEIILEPTPELNGAVYSTALTVKLGDETKTRQVNVEFTGTGKQETPTGFFALPNILAPENALNILLAIIAAILLIAFIARFTKRIN